MGKSNKPRNRPNGRTLGPVPDLERHLPQDWWRTLFNSVYLKTDGDVVEDDRNTAADVDTLIAMARLEPHDRVLDLCCGQGRHCLELARRGFRQVVGIDRSRYLIRLAKRRAAQRELRVSFHEGDARRFRLEDRHFRCVALLGNSFGYFDHESDDLAVLRAVSRALVAGGTVFLDLTDGNWMREHYEARTWEWTDQMHLVCRERSLSSDDQRLISREVVIHAERGIIVDQFYAERLYSEEAIVELLGAAGFEGVEVRPAPVANSDRGQDLGMMARRMIVTGRQPVVQPARRRQSVPFPEVTVLLGDPSLPDSCKRDGRFNDEDLETIGRLHEALAQLRRYRFQFVDRHAGLLGELQRYPPAFVFNLCDEGYQNDALKELHVPALLEVLGVPYSGAGPAALGLCYNKSQVRAIAEGLDIPVPYETYCDPFDQGATLPSVLPALVKPATGDSSVGITVDSVVDSAAALLDRLDQLRSELPGRALLIQELLTGREFSVGLVGNPGQGYRYLPILEVDYSGLPEGLPQILGYESKWLPDSAYWSTLRYTEADLGDDERRSLCDWSAQLFERLGCRDYARFDFRCDAGGNPKLLEVNPNPGWCWDGKLNLMAGFAGMGYAELLDAILEAAQRRCKGVSGAVARGTRGRVFNAWM
ncbi:MAG: methyltransferase domain-containing protein [Myxococcales bacterium]|nr:methyltransferase domain-containing protein [Myxococcales bacterium]